MKQIKKKNTGFFKENYSLSWKYIKESFVPILLVIFLLFLGFFTALVFQPEGITNAIRAFLEKILADTANFNVFEITVYILNNNLKNSFFSMFFGILFGVMPVFSAISNGYVLGFVSQKSVLVAGPLILFRLVPHGIFEFPAIIISLAMGIRLSRYQFSTGVKEKWKSFLAFALSFVIFIAIFFVISGFIMVISSPSIMDGKESFSLMQTSSIGYFMQIVFFIAAICSYILSNFIGNLVFEKKDRESVKKEFIFSLAGSLRVFLFVVMPLLVIAAIIEGILISLL